MFLRREMHSLDAIYRTLPALLCRLQAVGRVLSGKARWHILAAAVFLSFVLSRPEPTKSCRVRGYGRAGAADGAGISGGHAGRRRRRWRFSCVHLGGHVCRGRGSSAAWVVRCTVRGECCFLSPHPPVLLSPPWQCMPSSPTVPFLTSLLSLCPAGCKWWHRPVCHSRGRDGSVAAAG